jgi:hypothetical protein
LSFFASDAFLEVLAETRFPGRRAAPVVVEVGEERFRLLSVGRRRIVTRAPFLDYHTPLEESSERVDRSLGYIPRADRGAVDASVWREAKTDLPWMAAPLVDWARFPDWAGFQEHAKSARSGIFRDTGRRLRRLEEDVGKLEMLFDADPKGLLDTCIEWKAAQYEDSGLRNAFSDRRNVALFEELARRGKLLVSALLAGGRPAALHLGTIHDGRFNYWLPAFDRRLHQYAPGRALLHHMLEESLRHGHRSFEFLIGDEAYKLDYATHVRLIGAVGRPPALPRAWQQMRPHLASALRRMPAVHSAFRTVKNRGIRGFTSSLRCEP